MLEISLSLLGQIFLKLILRTLLSVLQILEQPYHIRLQQSKSLSPTDRNFVFFDLLQLVDPAANVDPAAG